LRYVGGMSDEALIAELERQREFARQCFAHYARQEEQGVILEGPRPDISEITRPLTAVLTAHPVFGSGRNVFFATMQLNLHPHYVPQGLLRMMLASDAPSAVAWLHRLFEIDRADLRMVAAVHGLDVQQPLNLINGVRLLPLAAAPDSPRLRMLARRYQVNPWSMMDVASVMPPTIAVIDMGSIAASTDHTVRKAAHDSAYDALLDAARAFTLADHGAPVVGNSWTEFVDPALARAEFGIVWMSARFEGSLSQAHPLNVDGEALFWAERYLQIGGPLRRSVDVALDRLNLARRRRSPGDQAIDSGICLEALLGDDNPQELTYKLRLRAALLLGNTLAEREEIRQAVRDLYHLRSKVVHGRARGAEDTLPDQRCASRGLEICKQAVRAIVRRNARPDFAAWELTGGPRDNEGA
jgi:hypothetical protein